MRKQQLTMFVTFLVFTVAAVAAAAQTPTLAAASQRNELQRVNVVRGTDEIRVEISARGAVTPKLSTADSPARLIVDLPGTVMVSGQSRISVGSAGVKGVRIGMDSQTPPTTRVVVDLEHSCRYELTPSVDGKLVLTLHTGSAMAAITKAPKTAAAETSPVASQSVSPFAPRVIEVKQETKREVAANVAPPATDLVIPKTVTATAAPAPQKAEPVATSDFVFVEPTYAAKPNTADSSVEPANRAQEAAARFADQTAPELLPVSMHAAQSGQSASSSTGISPAVNLAAEQKSQAGQQPA